jgi:signal transduction histidine kinase
MSPKASDWTTLFRSRNVPLAHLRTAYEQKIREAAGLEERHRLARDLHDSIKQQVFVIQTAAATAQARFDDDRDGARSALEEIRAAGREAMAEMETMLDQLRSAALENTGLVEALKRHCEALGFRTGAEVSFEVGALPPSESFAPGAHQAILRVAQEALANVGRHARARHVWVRLGADSQAIALAVRDDGVGYEAARPGAGMGLESMRARAGEFGGTLSVSTSVGHGTTIRLELPFATGEDLDVVECRRAARWSLGLLAVYVLFALLSAVRGSHRNPALLPWMIGLLAASLVRALVLLRRARRLTH